MLTLTTVSDKNYLDKGLALIESIKQFLSEYKLYYLCLDDETYNKLVEINDPNVIPLLIDDEFERNLDFETLVKNNTSVPIGMPEDYYIKNNLFPDYSVTIFQAEDVFEHIKYELLLPIINEIYRVLKTNGLFRLSVPDYRCDILRKRCMFDGNKIVFDIGGGGSLTKPGHLWFPIFESVSTLLNSPKFTNINYLHYYKEDGNFIVKNIDYSIAPVSRTPDFDDRVKNPYRPLSLVVDLIK